MTCIAMVSATAWSILGFMLALYLGFYIWFSHFYVREEHADDIQKEYNRSWRKVDSQSK